MVGASSHNPFMEIQSANATFVERQTLGDLTKLIKDTTETFTSSLVSLTNKLEALTTRVDSMSGSRTPVNDRRPNQRNLICFYCRRPGHTARDCWKKQRDLQNNSQGNATSNATEGNSQGRQGSLNH